MDTTTFVVFCVTGIICDTGPSTPAEQCLDACREGAGVFLLIFLAVLLIAAAVSAFRK